MKKYYKSIIVLLISILIPCIVEKFIYVEEAFSFIRFGFDCVARLFGNRAGRRHINAW